MNMGVFYALYFEWLVFTPQCLFKENWYLFLSSKLYTTLCSLGKLHFIFYFNCYIICIQTLLTCKQQTVGSLEVYKYSLRLLNEEFKDN